ncbi:portal protein [Arthrobacter phage Tank]|uniref:Portal protein n=2 Tax=Tankvirus tank TaxID=1982567 RepID=A0A0U4KS27_9CAUD|nr:portal protein [Arthrobacter phage Tank]ALY10552.1 portal protein [Arthrobacter phage Tank]ALY10803.1 portal protein [Arthrobacter phage Wilde]
MGRMKTLEIAPAPVSLVASAARIRGGYSMGTTPRNTTQDAWHSEMWTHYRNIGEFRYACDWIGGMLSKAIIYGTVETVDGIERVEEGKIPEYLTELFGNADGRAEMFRLIGIHLSVTGECNILAYTDPDPFGDGGDKWEIAASTKVSRPIDEEGFYTINGVLLPVPANEVLCIRLWRPDPEEPHMSFSPGRSVISTLRQLHKLTQYIDAQIDSRLAGAGILLMPDNMTLPPAPTEEGEEPVVKAANSAEELMSILMEAMMASIQNRDHASSMVPIVVTASAEAIAAVKHMTFWSELDEHAIELRKEAIGRLGLGMDVPPEVLQGSSDSNHWSAWQADESAIKAHAEPLLKIITTALGSHYLRPLLKDDPEFMGMRLSAFSVAADTSEMRLRPNRSKEALELYNLGELSGAALRRETGFDERDKMGDDELAIWLTRKVAQGSTTPEIVEAALKELGVRLTIIRPVEDAPQETVEGRPAPSIKDHPTNDIPDQERSSDRKQARDAGRVPSADIERKASLLAASEQVVIRALERAGNKLKNKMGGLKINCAASDLYQYATGDPEFLLDDAWGHIPMIAKRARVNPQHLEMLLTDYTTRLLTSQIPHTYEDFCQYMGYGMVPLETEGAAA